MGAKRLATVAGGAPTALLAALLLLAIVAFGLAADGFASEATAASIMSSSAWIGVLAVATTLALSAGSIDFSVMSVMALCGIVGAWIGANVSPILTIPAVVACGLLAGACNAFMVVRLGTNAFLATLITGGVIRGIDFSLGKGQRGVRADDPLLREILRTSVGPVPISFVFVLVLGALALWLLHWTTFGRALIAAGGNPEAANIVGLRPARVQTIAYLLSGTAAAFAGLLFASRVGAGVPNAGAGQELALFGAVLIAGTSLFGGRANVIGSILAVLLLQTAFNGLVLLGYNDRLEQVLAGLLLIVSVSVTTGSLSNLLARRRRRRHPPRSSDDPYSAQADDPDFTTATPSTILEVPR